MYATAHTLQGLLDISDTFSLSYMYVQPFNFQPFKYLINTVHLYPLAFVHSVIDCLISIYFNIYILNPTDHLCNFYHLY